MSIQSKIAKKLIPIAIMVLGKLAKDTKVQKAAFSFAQDIFKNLFDFFQVTTGQINLQSCEEAIETAITSCIRTEEEELVRVTAFITALYAQHKIHRGAQVGGSLRKRFGSSWFPHIKERELRYALKVDKDLEEYLYQQILSGANLNIKPIP